MSGVGGSANGVGTGTEGIRGMHTILIVDDEQCVLTSLVRELRKEPYVVITAGSGQEGLDLLRAKKVSVILSDMQMPAMNGVEFLSAARELAPDAVKMILSGYSDSQMVMSAINSGVVWRYLTKPWQVDELRVAFQNALQLYDAQLERQRLVLELQQKNAELANWSHKLEETVREQTRELYNQGILLRMILDGQRFFSLIPILDSYLGELFPECPVYFFLPQGALWMRACSEPLLSAPLQEGVWEAGHSAALEQRGMVCTGGALFYPLLDGEEYYGMILIPQAGGTQEPVEHYLDGYATIATIALRQERLGRDSGQIISNIDALLGELQ